MIKRLARTLLSVGFILLFIYIYASNPDSVTAVKTVGIAAIGFAVLYQLVVLFIGDLLTKTLVDRLGHKKLSLVDGYYSAFISSFGNYFLPLTGGAFLRAVFLKRQHDFSYKKFVSISYGSYIISFFIVFGTALLALLFLFMKDGIFIPSLFLVVLGIFIFSTSLMSKRYRIDSLIIMLASKFKFGDKLAKVTDEIRAGWLDIINTPGLLRKMIWLTALNLLTRAIFYYVVFTVIGAHTNILFMLLFTSLISISLYVTITPGSLGIRESLLVFYSDSIHLTTDQVLAVNLVDRVSLVLALILLLAVFEFVFKRRLGDFVRKSK